MKNRIRGIFLCQFSKNNRKMLLGALQIIILYFIVTEGQMAWNPHLGFGNYSGSETRGHIRRPADMRSNGNFPAPDNSNYNNPADPNLNRRPAVYNPNNNNPAGYNSNNNNPADYNSNNNNPAAYNSNNNNPADYNSNINNPVAYDSNRRPPAYNPNINNPIDYNSYNNNPSNNNPAGYNSNYKNPAGYNSNYNNPANYNFNRRLAAYNPSINNPANYNSNNNNPTYYNSNNNNPTYYNSNKRPADYNSGQYVRDPPAAGYNPPSNFSQNIYNPNNNKDPNNYSPYNNRTRNREQKSSSYIYYQTDARKGGRIVCLFTAAKFLKSGFDPTMVPARLCTVVNYEFAILNSTTYEISSGHPNLDYGQEFYKKTVGLKYSNPFLKVMLSMGGWADSTKKYSDLVASPRKVNNFITKAVKFLKDNRFDGLDVAWEYPNCWQGALGVSKADKPNYANFLQKLRQAFDRENLLLSISVSSIQREIKAGFDAPKIAKAVHYVNVMTYDMHGPWEKQTGHHSQFDKTSNDSDPTLNSKAAMEFWASIGVPKIKLNMGIASYATTFTLKDAKNHGLGAPAKGPGKAGALSHNAGTLYYREICQYLDAGNWTEEENEVTGFYAYSGDQWAGYDDPRMVILKTRWIADNGYGGLLIKDVSGDDYEQKCFAKSFPLIWIAGMEFTLRLKGTQ